MKNLSLAAVVVAILFTGAAVSAGADAVSADLRAPVSDVPLRGGVAALLRAVDAPGTADPATAMLAFIRVVHTGKGKPPQTLLRLFDAISRVQGAPTDLVPLPLSPGAWASVLGRKVPRDQLASAIFSDQRASLLYRGLMALDDETLAYLENHSSLLSAIANRGAGPFAEWGRSIHVRNGVLQLPGGPTAAALWEAAIGEAPSDTERFIRALVGRDGGRPAFLFDAVNHLEAPRQAFALGQALRDDRAGRFKALYSAFAVTKSVDASGAWPIVRHPVSPAAVLSSVLVAEGGRMAAPSSRAFWEAVFAGNPRACAGITDGGREADAAWLADALDRQFAEKRAEWLATVTFAQRVFGRVDAARLPVACEVVASFPHDQALLLSLERMRVQDPADYLAALHFTGRLWSGTDRRAAVVRTAQAQGVLVILERAFSARVIDADAARRLALSLMNLAARPGGTNPAPSAEGELVPGAVGRWMQRTLLPALCPGQLSADACAIHAVSGEGAPGRNATPLTWEEQDYQVDLGSATAARVKRIREAQRATPIDDALTLLSLADELSQGRASEDETRPRGAAIERLAAGGNLDAKELFGHGIPEPRSTLQSVAARLASPTTANDRVDAASSLVGVADLLLADALASFAYALSIGEPDDPALMGGDPARHHRFDAALGPATAPWHLAEEVQTADHAWLVEGSLLGLQTVFAKSWLRRLSIQDPGMRPRPDPQDVQAFGEAEVLFNAFDLTDAGRDAIVAAIRRGQARWANLIAARDGMWPAAAAAGISEWRCRAAAWAAARGTQAGGDGERLRQAAPGDYVSLAELMWLGSPDVPQNVLDAWGVSRRMSGGGLMPEMPRGHSWEEVQGPRGVGLLPAYLADVHLHVAEMLFDLRLPAVLAPGVSSYVVWDVLTAAEMTHPDDWLALVRAVRSLPDDRRFDYVSTLTATGPLVPAK